MKVKIFVLVIVLISSVFGCSRQTYSDEEIRLWPEIEPFRSGYLNVSDIHEIYYELCGNPKGIPVFVIHGGPGAGCSPYMRRFFNPEKYLIVLHDQRGCGKSKPTLEIRDNTTDALVKDIEQLRLHLELDSIILFGGSWGSTLSLAYAEEYPKNIIAMVFRGIYLSTREENINYYTNLNRYYPEEYHKIMELLPDSISELTDPALMKLYQSDKKQLDVTSRLELKAERLYIDDKELDEYFSSAENMKELNTIYGIYYHYLVNSCFLEEGQLLNNISKIQHVPVTIINGRHDLICPPLYAYILHKKLPSSNLIIAEKAGHVMSEKPIERELLKAMERLEELMDQKNIMND